MTSKLFADNGDGWGEGWDEWDTNANSNNVSSANNNTSNITSSNSTNPFAVKDSVNNEQNSFKFNYGPTPAASIYQPYHMNQQPQVPAATYTTPSFQAVNYQPSISLPNHHNPPNLNVASNAINNNNVFPPPATHSYDFVGNSQSVIKHRSQNEDLPQPQRNDNSSSPFMAPTATVQPTFFDTGS